MKPEGIAFLREIETPEEAIRLLEDESSQAIFTGEVLASYLRSAWQAGRNAARDPYRWVSVADLIDQGRGA